MTYGCKIMVSLTLCGFFGPPCSMRGRIPSLYHSR